MNRTTMTMTFALGFILVVACSKSRSGDTDQRSDAGSESAQGEGGGPASLSSDAGRPMDAGPPNDSVVEAGTDAGWCAGDGPTSSLQINDFGVVQIPDTYATGCECDDDCVLVEADCGDCCLPEAILGAALECFNEGRAAVCADTLGGCDCESPDVEAACDSGVCVVRDANKHALDIPEWSSDCDELARLECESNEACGWALSDNFNFFVEGCFQRCPCGPGAQCETALSDSDTCGQPLCLPDKALPILCGMTGPCQGQAASICWLQHPGPCGPCESCVDEDFPAVCLVSPEGVRHWTGQPDNGELILESCWRYCDGRPEQGECN